MASKLQTTIKLYLKDEEGNFTTKQFKSAEMLPGSVMEDATELQVELEEIVKTNDMEEIGLSCVSVMTLSQKLFLKVNLQAKNFLTEWMRVKS